MEPGAPWGWGLAARDRRAGDLAKLPGLGAANPLGRPIAGRRSASRVRPKSARARPVRRTQPIRGRQRYGGGRQRQTLPASQGCAPIQSPPASRRQADRSGRGRSRPPERTRWGRSSEPAYVRLRQSRRPSRRRAPRDLHPPHPRPARRPDPARLRRSPRRRGFRWPRPTRGPRRRAPGEGSCSLPSPSPAPDSPANPRKWGNHPAAGSAWTEPVRTEPSSQKIDWAPFPWCASMSSTATGPANASRIHAAAAAELLR